MQLPGADECSWGEGCDASRVLWLGGALLSVEIGSDPWEPLYHLRSMLGL